MQNEADASSEFQIVRFLNLSRLQFVRIIELERIYLLFVSI